MGLDETDDTAPPKDTTAEKTDDKSGQICYGQGMGNESEKPSEPTNLPPQSSDQTEQRLQILEKTNEKMFSLLVWGFGTLSALAFALVAGNIYSSHSNYERDTVNLTKDVELLQKQLLLAQQDLTASNDKKLFELKTETELSFTTISNSLQNQFIAMSHTNDMKWFNVVTAITNAGDLIKTNLLSLDSQIKLQVFEFMTNNLYQWVNDANAQLATFQTNTYKQTATAIGGTLLVEANYMPKKTLTDKQYAFHDYILSALYFLRAGDEANASQAIENLLDKEAFQLYLVGLSKDVYKAREGEHPISEELKELITQLKTLNSAGRYDNELRVFKFCEDVITDRLLK